MSNLSLEITGAVYHIGETITRGKPEKPFLTRDLVLECVGDNPAYPQLLSFQLTQDRTALADGLKVGQECTVKYNLRGREWVAPDGVRKFFNTLEAWRVESGLEPKETPLETTNVTAPLDFSSLAPAKGTVTSPDGTVEDLPF